MERRTFVKKSTLLSSAILLFSTSDMFASNNNMSPGILDLSSGMSSGDRIDIKGMVLDSETLLPVTASVEVHTKRKRFFSNKKSTVSNDGAYSLKYNLNGNEKKSDKIYFEIKAEGYKPFIGNLYVTSDGCNIHSDIWKYNPGFKPELGPKNQKADDMLVSTFNFYLVKQ